MSLHVPLSLLSLNSPSFESTLDWLQASFATQEGGNYIQCPIRTHQDIVTVSPSPGLFQANLVTTYIQQRFSGHLFPPSPPITLPSSQPASQDPLPYRGGGGTSNGTIDPDTPSNTRISWGTSTPIDRGSLIPGRQPPGQYVHPFCLHICKRALISLCFTYI